MVDTTLDLLVEISQFYGKNSDYVIAGGGNTSYKTEKELWVKASGTSLATINRDGFVCLSRQKLEKINTHSYTQDSSKREEEVKNDLAAAIIEPQNLRPSVETSMHNIINYKYIVHTHPTLVNALMCALNAKQQTARIFGDDVLYIEYTDPGYVLFKKVLDRITEYKQTKGVHPQIILLQNHGVFVSADSVDEIKEIYKDVEAKLNSNISKQVENRPAQKIVGSFINEINKLLAEKDLVAEAYNNSLIQSFISSKRAYENISQPFTPDIIVYCKSKYLFIESSKTAKDTIVEIDNFYKQNTFYPKLVIVENKYLVVIGENPNSIKTILDVFIDMMKISYLSNNFGGHNFMTKEQIDFIDNWEVENYRRKVSKQS